MKAYRNILAIADPQHEGSWALQRAGQVAAASGATLHLRAFCHHPAIAAVHAINASVAELAQKQLLRERQDWLEREADTLRATVTEVRAQAVWGTPIQEKVISEVLSLKPDLVVKDVEHVPTLKRLFFTPLDWHLLRVCPVPLLLVNRAPRPSPQRIVAAVDIDATYPEADELAEDILRAARNFASLSRAPVHLLHVFGGLPPPVAGAVEAGLASAEIIYKQLREERETAFREFADRHQVPKDCRHLLDGLHDMALTGFAQDFGADVVVMGSVNRTGLDRILIGSTAERILSQLGCDVLVLKPRRLAELLQRHYSLERAA